ncbi:MAG TPA: ATP-binding protein [Vicinamibacterales bacterium]|nr:ATP-binding protein [Vicinamibacterales bacterium]
MNAAERDLRILLMTPTAKDGGITAELLGGAGISTTLCRDVQGLVDELNDGAAAVMIAEEHLNAPPSGVLQEWLSRQPPWSDLPILILTRPGADSPEAAEAWRTLGNVTLLERPTRVTTLLSAAQTAIRARSRQYQIRGHLAERLKNEQALRSADRRKDEFLATLGHELRNPLAPILNSLEILKLSGAFDDARTLQACAVMERQVHHLNRLVDDLLEVSRITRGIIEVKKEPLDLTSIVRAAIETSRPVLDNMRHELIVDLAPEPMHVGGDPVRLAQVFANLLNNAAKYTNHGGRIAVATRRENGEALVSVKDNGIGIAPALLSQVFDMFMQVDRSTRRSQGGLGIGLTLVRSLVTMHGGTVEARSAGPGLGSEFIVRLPLLTEAAIATAPHRRIQPLPSRRILIVDDSRDGGESLAMLLRVLGAEVALAHSGRTALECVDSFKPDVVLLDIGMPGMDGYEVARRIRANPANRNISLIALTGWGQDEDRKRSVAAGFNHHLVKPADIEQLRQLLTVA